MNDDLPKIYIQKTPGTYKIEKLNNIIGIDEIHSKCDCSNGSFVNGVREPTLFSFALDKIAGQKVYKELGV